MEKIKSQNNKKIAKKQVSRGYGNTPSMNTNLISSNSFKSQSVPEFSVCTDWLSCTFPYSKEFDYFSKLIKSLKLQGYEYDLTAGLNGYKQKRVYDEDTFLQLDGPLNKDGIPTSNLVMSGSACRRFEERGGNWVELWKTLLVNYSARCSRYDMAIDYYGTEIDMDWINKKLELGYFSSRFENVQIIKSYNLKSKISTGYSITFGNHGSMLQFQIYDKVAERRAKDKAVNCPNWIRFEARFGQGKAHDILLKFMEQYNDIPFLAPEILNDIIEFKVPKKNGKPTDDSNKSRWDIDPKWQKFLKTAQKFRIMNYFPQENTIASKKRWFDYSMTKLYTLLSISSPNKDMDEIYYIAEGIKRMKKNDLLIVNKYREEKGLEKITRKDLSKIIEEISGELIKESDLAT